MLWEKKVSLYEGWFCPSRLLRAGPASWPWAVPASEETYQLPGCQARSVPPVSQPGTQRSLQTEQWLAGPRRPPPVKTSVTRASPLFPTWWCPQSSDLYSEPAAARDRNIPATAATWPSHGTDLRLLGWDPAFLLFCFWWPRQPQGGQWLTSWAEC